MPHYNLPHNHGQNMERVLNKMPHTCLLYTSDAADEL